MSLDLIIRGAGSSRSPGEHLMTLAGEYSSAYIILYGEHELEGSVAATVTIAAEPDALAEAIKAAGDTQVLVYGDESLLTLAQHLQPGLIWITLGSDANGVREIWRIRQQHSWLSSKKLALLIEQMPENPQPDTERLMRLSRATRALLVVQSETAAETPAEPEAEPAAEPEAEVAEAAVIEAAFAEAEVAVAVESAAEAEVEPAVAAEPVNEPEIPAEPEVVAESEPVAAPAAVAEPIIETKGADVAVETTSLNYVAEKPVGNAQEALIQRYALVKERRATSQRIAQVEETMQNLLKDLFVSRFAAGPEAAAAFEAISRKLTDASAEFTQLSRTMANLEQQLAKLAWVKDELEI